MIQQYDMIIVGGGLVGAGLASALSHELSIALVDAKLPSQNDPRLFALNASSCHFLKNIGLWSQLERYACPINEVHVSNQGHFGSVRLKASDAGLTSLGCVIPAKRIEAALYQSLYDAVTLYCPAKLIHLEQDNGMAFLTLETETGEVNLKAPLIIGADGADSKVRELAHIPFVETDYGRSALVMTLALTRAHHHVAYERFNREGAIAMLPLVNEQGEHIECAMIWTAETPTISHLKLLSDEEMIKQLQSAFGYRLGKLQKPRERFVYPLRMVIAQKQMCECVYLLGNAAHTLSPIAAQGFNLALYEVALFVDMLIQKGKQKLTMLDLTKMNEQIKSHQARSIGLSHRLSTLFAAKSRRLHSILQFGMLGLDLFPPIKKRFIKEVMGTRKYVPPLLLSVNDYEEIKQT